MIVVKGTGFVFKREHTPLCEVFNVLNEMYHTGIIGGYLVNIEDDGRCIITIIERG